MGRLKRAAKSLANLFRGRRKGRKVKPSRNYNKHALVLLNPVYEDPVTPHMKGWLNGLRIPQGLGNQQSLSGPTVNRAAVLAALRDASKLKRIEVFCGHGVAEALLGPPQINEPIIKVGAGRHSPVYDAQVLKAIYDQTVKTEPAALFAFCCSAGAEFGKEFCSFKDNSFLGYSEELPIETANDQCINALKEIFQTITAEIIEAGEVLPQHEQRLKNMYHEAYLYFFSGEGRRNNRASYMWLALNEHRRFVCRFGGRP